MLPQTFEEWKNCITNDCKINLTKDFAKSRLNVYMNRHHPETIKFKELYGNGHFNNIIYWLKKV